MPDKKNFTVPEKVVVVYKHSQLSYALDSIKKDQKSSLHDDSDPLTKSLKKAHEKNLACIDALSLILTQRGIPFTVVSRSAITKADLADRFIISVGGDGTLLSTSHFCDDSMMLGVNSYPDASIGALCAANPTNLASTIDDIYQGKLLPIKLARLAVFVEGRQLETLALNDVLFCHKNPAAMSRFSLSLDHISEGHRSSGIWVATAAGSTGGIYSCGGEVLPLVSNHALFRVRESYWTDLDNPQLLHGMVSPTQTLRIRSTMTDAQVFIDGPYKSVDIILGETVDIRLAEQPLWLFDADRLEKNRTRIIKQRTHIRHLL